MYLSRFVSSALLICILAAWHQPLAAQDQKMSNFDREVIKQMLHFVEDDIQKHYYDPKYHGLNLEVRFRQAEQAINGATSGNSALIMLASAVADLNDSHTTFLPPSRPFVHEYGWEMQAIGDKGAFVTAVRPGSDADKKGVKPGDQVLAVNGIETRREDLWKLRYIFWVLNPMRSIHVQLKSPSGSVREVDIQAYVRPTKAIVNFNSGLDYLESMQEMEREANYGRSTYTDIGNIAVIKLKNFEWDPDSTGAVLGKIRARPATIVDLRGNPGGVIQSMVYLIGGFFDHEVKVADRVGRKELKPTIAKPFGRAYTGKVIVLIDSDSASCAEMFARIMQLEKRATIVGDRSDGSAMEAMTYSHQIGMGSVIPFEVSVSEANMLMPDGKSLEHVGVSPDLVMVPTPDDLAAKRDPVMAYAINTLGGKMTPEDAGKLFPIEWPALSNAVFGSH